MKGKVTGEMQKDFYYLRLCCKDSLPLTLEYLEGIKCHEQSQIIAVDLQEEGPTESFSLKMFFDSQLVLLARE